MRIFTVTIIGCCTSELSWSLKPFRAYFSNPKPLKSEFLMRKFLTWIRGDPQISIEDREFRFTLFGASLDNKHFLHWNNDILKTSLEWLIIVIDNNESDFLLYGNKRCLKKILGWISIFFYNFMSLIASNNEKLPRI